MKLNQIYNIIKTENDPDFKLLKKNTKNVSYNNAEKLHQLFNLELDEEKIKNRYLRLLLKQIEMKTLEIDKDKAMIDIANISKVKRK